MLSTEADKEILHQAHDDGARPHNHSNDIMHDAQSLQVLEGSQWSQQKRDGHLSAIRQEVDSLRKLRGSLNVATLEDVYEDENQVHIIMELCRGGELVHRIGSQHYSERTVRVVSPAGLVGVLALRCLQKGRREDASSETPRDLVSCRSGLDCRRRVLPGRKLHACSAQDDCPVPLPPHPAPGHQAR